MKRVSLTALATAASALWAAFAWADVPAAVVEEVSGASVGVEFMDYVPAGKVIKLGPRDTIVLGYLTSCWRETITGGTVTVGTEQSDVQGGKVARTKVRCNGGQMRLASQQANASGASSFRLQSAPIEPVLYAVPPMVQIPRLQANDNRTLVIERIDRPGQRIEVAVAGDLANGAFLDLAKADIKPLTRGGVYRATLGSNKVTFKVDAKAKIAKVKPGKAKAEKLPIVSRLLRFPPG